jgi:hypothetical protein
VVSAPTVERISTAGRTAPYLTVAELRRSPVWNQLRKLVAGETAADNEAELGRIILRVSAKINGECNQNLAAPVHTAAREAVVSDRGELR